MRQARGQREQGAVRDEPAGKGIDRPVVGGGGAELQSAELGPCVPAGIRAEDGDKAGRGADKTERGEAGEGARRV